MDASTVFLSRLIGVAAMGLGAAMLVAKPPLLAAMEMAADDRLLLTFLGVGGVVAGAAIVATHNIWSRGLCPLAVTLTGWVILARGALVLILPAQTIARAAAAAHYAHYFYAYAAVPLMLGAFLTYRGFAEKPAPRRR